MSHTDLEEITDPSGRRSVTFHRDHHGFYGFQEYVWFDDEEIDMGEDSHTIPGGWSHGVMSGLHSSLEEAKTSALELPWFRVLSLRS